MNNLLFGEITPIGRSIAPLIDHTLLKPEADEKQFRCLCEESVRYGFATVCVPPTRVVFVAQLLKGTRVKKGTVIGFPFGYTASSVKTAEAAKAVDDGADELDMVMAVAALKDKNFHYVLDDIKQVVKAADGRTVKVIIETCFLTREEKITACRLVIDGGAQFVKTSTGLAGGATEDDVRLLHETAGKAILVKASGGIRSERDALIMIQAGAARLGTSSGVVIVTGENV
jgi:deoxyribose-phosphate aldolase